MKQKLLLLFLLLMSYTLLDAQTNELSLNFINPAVVPANQEADVTLTGTGFAPEMTVNLSSVGIVSSSFIDASTMMIHLPSLSAGTYSVTIASAEGSSNALDLLVMAADTPIVSAIEPQRIQAGTQTTISIFGSGFTEDLVVRLQGYGLIPTTFVNSAALTAELPASLAARESYSIELISGDGVFYPTSHSLRVVAPPAPSPMPERATQVPIPTEAPLEPNLAPLLRLSSFSVNPATIDAGQTATVNFTIHNRGNDTARMISVNLASSTTFVPASGQVALVLPDLAPGASASGQMLVTASQDIAAGAAIIPLTIEYQNPLGDSFSANADLTVTVTAPGNSQLVINAYQIDPSPSEAGEAVRLQFTLFNRGESAITQVLLRINGGVLIPQGTGDSIPIADIAGRQTAPVELSMLVSSSAATGHQMQPISISYQQNGESHEVSSSIMVDVVASSRPQPLLLLASYESSVENLQPGSRFNLSIELENAGTAPARNTLITFGTVQADASEEGSTGLSASFAPLGSAGLDFVGDIESGSTISSAQEFMVSGSLESGIYLLPITLQYTLPDGTNATERLSISLVVIAPPQLQFRLEQGLPESVYAGDFVPVSIEIVNNGADVNLQEAIFTVDNGEVLEGSSIELSILKEGEETLLDALLIPMEEGELTLSLTLHYTDELNQAQSIILSYNTMVIEPVFVEDFSQDEPTLYEEEFVVEESDPNWFGRIMMAFFGLGS